MAQVNLGISLPNDSAREDFLRHYTDESAGWYLYEEAPKVQRRWYRRDFDGWSVVVEEADHDNVYRVTGDRYRSKRVMQIYMIDDDRFPLATCLSVKTRIMSRLRDLTRNGGTV